MPHARDDVLEATEGLTGVTIPVHVEIETTQVILAQPEMRELLGGAGIIATGNCLCREGAGRCDHPLEVCIAMNGAAMKQKQEKAWRTISIEEAIGVLEKTYGRGLVHLAYRRWDGDIELVCSCCDCCCQPLNALKRFDVHDGIAESAFVARFDAGVCIGCGACSGRCVFGAFTPPDASGVASFDPASCFGCGLCVGSCPSGAIALVERPNG